MILDSCESRRYEEGAHEEPGDASSEEVGEWLGGLRAVGLPVRSVPSRAPLRTALRSDDDASDVRTRAPSTRAAYERDWLGFLAWCHAHDLHDGLQATPTDVTRYIAMFVDQRLSMATIRRRIAGITFAFSLTGHPAPTRTIEVQCTLAGAARTLGTGQRQAAPLRLEPLRHIVTSMPILAGRPSNHPVIRRDQILLLLGWAGALRRSELVALNAEDLTFTANPGTGRQGGLLIRIRRPETSKIGEAHVAIPYSAHWSTCPVRLAMLHARRVRTGPLFRHIDRHGRTRRRLDADTVSTIVKHHVATSLNEEPTLYSANSLRAGFVAEARVQHVPDHLIAHHTRQHGSRVLGANDRPVDVFTNHGLTGEWW